MRAVELVVVTGSQDNVRRAYSSGTPAIGVGAGNVPVIIEKTANLDDAAEKICASKIFDNSTSCSSENSVVIEDAIYDQAIAALERAGGYMCSSDQKEHIEKALWVGGKLNRNLIARGPEVLAPAFGLPEAAKSAKFFMVEEIEDRQISPILGREAVPRADRLPRSRFRRCQAEGPDDLGSPRAWPFVRHSYQESGTRPRACRGSRRCPRRSSTSRTPSATAAASTQELNFTLSMGCGSWQKNSISENLNYKHFLNITHLVTPITPDKPGEEELFGPLWAKIGHKGGAA